MDTRRVHLLGALLVALTLPMSACCSSRPAPAPEAHEAAEPGATPSSSGATAPTTAGRPAAGTPEALLQSYIDAQESADWAAVADCLTEAAQDEFDSATENLTEDDLVETGLRTRQEDYRLESADDTTAIFWSREAKLYLVMTQEGGRWRIDPFRTDQLNLEGR